MTGERNKTIVILWNENKSSKEIAALLNVTKNTVIGVVNRLRHKGFITRPKENDISDKSKAEAKKIYLDRNSKRETKGKQEVKRSHRKRTMGLGTKTVSLPRLFQPAMKSARPTGSTGVSLMDLGHDQCRFPVSRIEDQHYFCGAPKRDALASYCEEHHAKCFMKRTRLSPEDLRLKQKGYAMKQWISGSDAAYRKSRNL